MLVTWQKKQSVVSSVRFTRELLAWCTFLSSLTLWKCDVCTRQMTKKDLPTWVLQAKRWAKCGRQLKKRAGMGKLLYWTDRILDLDQVTSSLSSPAQNLNKQISSCYYVFNTAWVVWLHWSAGSRSCYESFFKTLIGISLTERSRYSLHVIQGCFTVLS